MMNQPRIYSIKELNKYIRLKLESDVLLGDVWLRGEISNFTHHSSGHMYFTLKEKDSKLKCIMFASHNARLPFIPREGMKVMARGHVSVYERDGTYQFYAMAMQPDGLGSLYLAFEQLKSKLEQEGLFANERKRILPRFPRAIGIITSPTGAAIQDMLITIQRRYPLIPVYVYPVMVQGNQAAPSIVQAIEAMNRHGECDVLIVGRGGGSLEELWAFNEEAVARSIAASSIPVVSAVGHETDFTIADFVADLRAATPTAAAELAVPHIAELKQQVNHIQIRLQQIMRSAVRVEKDRLHRIQRTPIFIHPRKYLLEQAERLDRLNEQLQARTMRLSEQGRARWSRLYSRLQACHPGERTAFAARRLNSNSQRLEQSMKMSLREQKLKLHGLLGQLDALSPLKVMARGYGLVYNETESHLIRSIEEIKPGATVQVKLIDGQLECQVQSVKGESGHGGNVQNGAKL